ncbi:hypothetical protein F01_230008 [Burkholderia cenocepacia]|nr:hypothetical protein F01_230008 [Burkholderia cenocepacia]
MPRASSAFSTPMCEKPRAAPPPSAMPILTGFSCGSAVPGRDLSPKDVQAARLADAHAIVKWRRDRRGDDIEWFSGGLAAGYTARGGDRFRAAAQEVPCGRRRAGWRPRRAHHKASGALGAMSGASIIPASFPFRAPPAPLLSGLPSSSRVESFMRPRRSSYRL